MCGDRSLTRDQWSLPHQWAIKGVPLVRLSPVLERVTQDPALLKQLWATLLRWTITRVTTIWQTRNTLMKTGAYYAGSLFPITNFIQLDCDRPSAA